MAQYASVGWILPSAPAWETALLRDFEEAVYEAQSIALDGIAYVEHTHAQRTCGNIKTCAEKEKVRLCAMSMLSALDASLQSVLLLSKETKDRIQNEIWEPEGIDQVRKMRLLNSVSDTEAALVMRVRAVRDDVEKRLGFAFFKGPSKSGKIVYPKD